MQFDHHTKEEDSARDNRDDCTMSKFRTGYGGGMNDCVVVVGKDCQAEEA